MVLTLHGNPTVFSTCTQRVATVLKEKNIPFAFKQTGPAEVTAEYIDTMHPFAQIPVIDDDGFILYESRAICRYLCHKYADQGTQGLIPDGKDLKELANFEKALSIEATQFIAAELITFEIIFKPIRGQQPNQDIIQQFTDVLIRKLNAYERILSKSKYLAGEHVTLADLFHLPYGQKLEAQVLPGVMTSSNRPNVRRWWNDISSRESWLAVKDGLSL